MLNNTCKKSGSPCTLWGPICSVKGASIFLVRDGWTVIDLGKGRVQVKQQAVSVQKKHVVPSLSSTQLRIISQLLLNIIRVRIGTHAVKSNLYHEIMSQRCNQWGNRGSGLIFNRTDTLACLSSGNICVHAIRRESWISYANMKRIIPVEEKWARISLVEDGRGGAIDN